MATKVEELRQKAVEQTAQLTEKLATYSDTPPTDEQLAELNAMKDERAVTLADIDRHSRAAAITAELRGSGGGIPAPIGRDDRGEERKPKLLSVGQRFVENADYQTWLKMVAPTGSIPESAKGLNSPPLKFRGMRELEMQAALLTGVSDTSAGAMVQTRYYPQLTELGRRPLTIRNVVTNLQTDSDLVEFVRVTTETNNAAAVAEATGASDGTGVKPESVLAFEKVTTAVKTVAHWIPATKRALSDAAQLRGLIDQFLRYGLEEELEDQMINGDGTGENFTGISNTTGVQAQAWDTNILTTTRKARRKVRTVGRRIPNAFLLHPEDWEVIDLLQDNEARYYAGGPFDTMAPRLWGLPVIESEALTQGVGYVGDFNVAVLWDREDAAISVSDSHSDFFIRNLVAILAELRAAFGVLKPNAIVEIDLTA